MDYCKAMRVNVSSSITLSGSTLTATATPTARSETPASETFVENTQIIGITVEPLVVGDIGTVGWLFAVNNDVTNSVVLTGEADGTKPFAKLLPGQFCCVPAASATFYAKANVAPVSLSYIATSL